jgi:hypothetical protein
MFIKQLKIVMIIKKTVDNRDGGKLLLTMVRAVNEPSEPSFAQTRLDSFKRIF